MIAWPHLVEGQNLLAVKLDNRILQAKVINDVLSLAVGRVKGEELANTAFNERVVVVIQLLAVEL